MTDPSLASVVEEPAAQGDPLARSDPPTQPQAPVALISRFQPFDLGHERLLRAALAQPGQVLVVVAAAGLARGVDSPFSWQERAAMVMAAAGAQHGRIRLLPIRDVEDELAWADALRRGAACAAGRPPPRLAGFEGDEGLVRCCELLGWDPLPVPAHPRPPGSSLRDVLFGGAAAPAVLAVMRQYVPGPVLEYLRAWLALPHHRELCADWQAVQAMREEASGPSRPPSLVSAEALVHGADQVLMLRRAQPPGMGLWSLPGAMPGPDESLLQASLRALRRQTGIGMLQLSLRDALREVRVFDKAHRLPHARVFSHVHRFELGEHLPELHKGEDSLALAWLPFSALHGMQSTIFGDHFAILDRFFGLGDPLRIPSDGQG